MTRVIRVMTDYGVDVPLWDDDGHLGNDPAEIADELAVSSQLLAELRDWQREWEDMHPTRWLRGRLFDFGHRRRGQALVARLNEVAGPGLSYRLR